VKQCSSGIDIPPTITTSFAQSPLPLPYRTIIDQGKPRKNSPLSQPPKTPSVLSNPKWSLSSRLLFFLSPFLFPLRLCFPSHLFERPVHVNCVDLIISWVLPFCLCPRFVLSVGSQLHGLLVDGEVSPVLILYSVAVSRCVFFRVF